MAGTLGVFDPFLNYRVAIGNSNSYAYTRTRLIEDTSGIDMR
jgi:hypothetical protein